MTGDFLERKYFNFNYFEKMKWRYEDLWKMGDL
jgi:hypothetical protein